MLMSKLFGERLRAKPAEATLISHVFLLRGGYIRPVGSGIYSLMTPCVRVQRKIEKIIREEMDKIGGSGAGKGRGKTYGDRRIVEKSSGKSRGESGSVGQKTHEKVRRRNG